MEFNEHVKIDLHIHSTASDGTLSPLEILRLARQLNLGAIAITDHDTVAGSRDALALGMPAPPHFLTGVEISAAPPPSFSLSGSFHILGYSIDTDDPVLNQTLIRLQQARKDRNPQILEILNDLGFKITLDEVRQEAGECQLGRPHIAQLMVKKGFVQSIDEAFDKYLAKGQIAYVDKYRISAARAIEIILNAGGIPVLAHPFLLQIQNDKALEDLVVTLMQMGLQGIEVYYPEHTPQQTALYAKIAKHHRLLITGGTDFHGALKPEIQMGSGTGNLHIPFALYEQLINRKTNMSQTDHVELQHKLPYTFKNTDLLNESLRHSSYVNEQPDAYLHDNERLEYLGDAVLNLVVGDLLMQRYPDCQEGDLSRMRANLVNESQLATIARTINLGSYLQLGKGEIQTAGQDKNSILAGAFEALVAAIYQDGGFEAVCKIIDSHFSVLIDSMKTMVANHDYKSQIQELVQVSHQKMPVYTVAHESGPDHDKTFRVQLTLQDLQTEGVGKSKKVAEQDAARNAFNILKTKT